MARTAALGEILEAWRAFETPPSWAALSARLGGLAQSVCLIRWIGEGDDPVIEDAGAQAVFAYGAPLKGASVSVLTDGGAQAVEEARQARDLGHAFTAEDNLAPGRRRVARLYLKLTETPPAVACAVVRID